MGYCLDKICQFFLSYCAATNEISRKTDLIKERKWKILISDMLLGISVALLVFLIRDSSGGQSLSAEQEARWLSEKLDKFISWLQRIIEWLMGNPAGLKLNRPLNQTLGHFFLYHIYLWRTYVTFLGPLLRNVLLFLRWIGLLGFSFQVAALIDLIGVLTVHIYCFHIYAARLYQLHSTALLSLWRLFRGKKRNPLRDRVDSIEYDRQQLLLGCLLFTVLLFLLPTVLTYYVVFASLRLVTICSVKFLLQIPKFGCYFFLVTARMRTKKSLQKYYGCDLYSLLVG